MDSNENIYNIGDIIKNNITNKYYIVVDFEYKNTSRFYTIKDLSSNKLIINEWLNSIHLVWDNGNFNGYQKEYRISSENEMLSQIRKHKIKKMLDSDETEN